MAHSKTSVYRSGDGKTVLVVKTEVSRANGVEKVNTKEKWVHADRSGRK